MTQGRPDTHQLARQSVTIIAGAGETCTYRKWISAGSGANQFGVQNKNYYTTMLVTGMFNRFEPKIIEVAGGQLQVAGGFYGQSMTVTLPFQMSPRDELIWEGSAYRVDGNADHETMGWGHVLYSHPLKLANITG
jgi:hypothetical protein